MSPRLQAVLLTLTAVAMWGLAPVGTRYLLGTAFGGLPAASFAGLRYGLTALCFLPVALTRLPRWSRRDLAIGVGLGMLGVTGYNLANSMGMRTVSAGMSGLINAAEPLLIVLLVSLKELRLPRRATLGAAAVGMAGIGLLTHTAGPADGTLAGMALCLFAALCWSAYCVLVPPLLARRGALGVASVTMVSGALPLLAVGSPTMLPMLHDMSRAQWQVTIALTLGPTVVSIVAWNKGAARLGPEAAGWFLYLLPVIGVLGGAVQLGEPLSGVELAGGGLILASVFLAQRV